MCCRIHGCLAKQKSKGHILGRDWPQELMRFQKPTMCCLHLSFLLLLMTNAVFSLCFHACDGLCTTLKGAFPLDTEDRLALLVPTLNSQAENWPKSDQLFSPDSGAWGYSTHLSISIGMCWREDSYRGKKSSLVWWIPKESTKSCYPISVFLKLLFPNNQKIKKENLVTLSVW